jgi:hypothetical protein
MCLEEKLYVLYAIKVIFELECGALIKLRSVLLENTPILVEDADHTVLSYFTFESDKSCFYISLASE